MYWLYIEHFIHGDTREHKQDKLVMLKPTNQNLNIRYISLNLFTHQNMSILIFTHTLFCRCGISVSLNNSDSVNAIKSQFIILWLPNSFIS